MASVRPSCPGPRSYRIAPASRSAACPGGRPRTWRDTRCHTSRHRCRTQVTLPGGTRWSRRTPRPRPAAPGTGDPWDRLCGRTHLEEQRRPRVTVLLALNLLPSNIKYWINSSITSISLNNGSPPCRQMTSRGSCSLVTSRPPLPVDDVTRATLADDVTTAMLVGDVTTAMLVGDVTTAMLVGDVTTAILVASRAAMWNYPEKLCLF